MNFCNEILEGIQKKEIHAPLARIKTADDAIRWLGQICQQIDENSPLYYNQVVITEDISLWIPGKYDYKNPGDYLLMVHSKKALLGKAVAPTHEDVCDALVREFEGSEKDERIEKYRFWISLLADVYENGRTNIAPITIDTCKSEKERKEQFGKEFIFWITLQEDINKSEKLGRLRPFCRYAEALSTTQESFPHSYSEVISRLKASDPELLDRWDLPIMPSFYKWSAF